MKKYLLKKITVLAVSFLIFVCPILATDYYVDGLNGNNSNTGLSAGLAKRTIQSASNLTNPGDTVFIMNGTYTSSPGSSQNILHITRSGTAGNYITYKPFNGHSPKIVLMSNISYQIWRAVLIEASYIIFDGIEIEGANASLTYAEAYQTWRDYENGIKDWNKIAVFNAGSISMGDRAPAHHIIIRNCKIHDTGGGIGGSNCDYITIENNLIYNTCWYSMYAGSGISILDPTSIDAVTTYKIFIRNNIVHNNKTLIPWEKIDALSDGNGIILDVNIGTSTHAPYVGRYLVENNVSYNNGGGGVHAFKAAHVDIINNTAYNNGTVVGYPEIDANQCSDVKIYNNIMYARTGGNCNGNDANTTYDYNLYYNGPAYKKGPFDMIAEPQFINLAKDATADFHLKNTSPAINNGNTVAGQYSSKDITGISRPIGFSTDMGAYEYPTIIPRAEINIKQGITDIVDNTGAYDFGDVASTSPKTVIFTIENIGDLALNLTGTPKVAITGIGFSLETDAPAAVSPNGTVSFEVKLTTTSTGVYAGAISIANDDATENPYNFSISGYGYDGTKVLQTITFYAIPLKVIGDADFNPGALSSAGLPVTYTSSNTGVATIVAGKIHLVNAGTTTITASQAGDANTNVARNVSQLLTVTPVLPPAGTNMITNPTFDVNTTGWSFANKNSAAANVESVATTGSTTNVGKVTITNLGTTTSFDNVQLSTNVFVVKDRNYLITFKASADAPRNVDVRLLQNASPFSTIFSKNSIGLTTTSSTYGFYAFTSSYTGSIAFRFFLGNSSIPAYFDDVEMIEEASLSPLPIKLLSFNGNTVGNKVLLNWTTASEINAKEFVVEQSNNGSFFSPVSTIAAKNTANGGNYNFTDLQKEGRQVFYRLKLTDKDGSYTYSEVVLVKWDTINNEKLKLYPNPVISYLTISFPSTSVGATLSIFLTNGTKVMEYNLPPGATQKSINVSGLKSGSYFITFKNKKRSSFQFFIK